MANTRRAVSVPDELVELLRESKLSDVPVDDQVRRALAIHLFITRRVSGGRAARLALMPYAAFLDLLVDLGVPAFFLDETDARQDSEALAEYAKRKAAS